MRLARPSVINLAPRVSSVSSVTEGRQQTSELTSGSWCLYLFIESMDGIRCALPPADAITGAWSKFWSEPQVIKVVLVPIIVPNPLTEVSPTPHFRIIPQAKVFRDLESAVLELHEGQSFNSSQ